MRDGDDDGPEEEIEYPDDERLLEEARKGKHWLSQKDNETIESFSKYFEKNRTLTEKQRAWARDIWRRLQRLQGPRFVPGGRPSSKR